MGQNDLKPNVNDDFRHRRPISRKAASAFLCGASVIALSMLAASQAAMAQGFTITRQYYPGGSTTFYNEFGPGNGGITELDRPAPGNNCPIPAFEIVNPRPGEARCVGYVTPSWLTR
jgi:hypothetical protein